MSDANATETPTAIHAITAAEAARVEWLEQRRTGLGSSDAAAILGFSPWKTPLHVYMDKIGQSVDHDTPGKRAGRVLEPAVAELYRLETGQVPLAPAEPLVRHPDFPWLICSPDRYVADAVALSLIPLELKTTTSWEGWGPPGGDQVPAHYYLQVQHQMMATRTVMAALAALGPHFDLRLYRVAANGHIMTDMFDALDYFWREHVVAKVPPAPDWTHPGTPEILARLYRPTVAAPALELTSDEASIWADQYQAAGVAEANAHALKAEAKGRLCLLMRDHAEAVLADGRRLVRKEVRIRGHEVAARTDIRFRVVTPRGHAAGSNAGDSNAEINNTDTQEMTPL